MILDFISAIQNFTKTNALIKRQHGTACRFIMDGAVRQNSDQIFSFYLRSLEGISVAWRSVLISQFMASHFILKYSQC